MNIKSFAETVQAQTLERFIREYPDAALAGMVDSWAKAKIRPGRKYTRVDVGDSGKYMIDQAGNIYGIKAYGVPHLGKRFGTLETVDQFYWGGYYATRRAEPCVKSI